MDTLKLEFDKPVKSIRFLSQPIQKKFIHNKRHVERTPEEIAAIARLYNAAKPLSGIFDPSEGVILHSNDEEEVTLYPNMTVSVLNKNQQPDGTSNFSRIQDGYVIIIEYEDGTEEKRVIKHSCHTL